jgi:hypothetical protein
MQNLGIKKVLELKGAGDVGGKEAVEIRMNKRGVNIIKLYMHAWEYYNDSPYFLQFIYANLKGCIFKSTEANSIQEVFCKLRDGLDTPESPTSPLFVYLWIKN